MSDTTRRLAGQLEQFVCEDDDYTTLREFLRNVQDRIGEALRKGDYCGGPNWKPPCLRTPPQGYLLPEATTEDVDGLARTLRLNVGQNFSARPKAER
jgi:hypothetical protein